MGSDGVCSSLDSVVEIHMKKKCEKNKLCRPDLNIFSTNETPQTRAREPVRRTSGRVCGKFASRKMQKMIHWESQLERAAVLLFEYSPGIAAYREQPIKIHYTLDGKTRRYTPDFELTLRTGEIQYIEVKPLVRAQEPVEARRLERIREYFYSDGYTYRVITEADIQKPQLLENLNICSRYHCEVLTALERRIWKERFSGPPCFTFAEASRIAGSASNTWNLLAQGVITCDLHQPVNDLTLVILAKEGDQDAKFHI